MTGIRRIRASDCAEYSFQLSKSEPRMDKKRLIRGGLVDDEQAVEYWMNLKFEQ